MLITKTFLMALFAALVLTSGVGAQGVLAQGADAGAARPQGEMKDSEKGKEQDERSLEPGKGDASPKEIEERKTQESPQKKKPRLKYWDPFECGC